MTKRPLTFASLFWRLFRMDALVLGLVLIILLPFLAYQAITALPLAIAGIEVQGARTVLRSTSQICLRAECGPFIKRNDRYFDLSLRYVFETTSGAQFTATRSERVAAHRRQPVLQGTQSPVTLTYLPDDPDGFRIGGRAGLTRQFNFVAGLTVTVLLALTGLALRRASVARKGLTVRRVGKRRKATVIAPPQGTKKPERAALHWMLSDGRKGHSLPLRANSPRPGTGARIDVYDDGTQSWGEGDLFVSD